MAKFSKRIVAIIAIMMLVCIASFSLVACGGSSNDQSTTSEPKGTKLTLTNYDQYLTLSCTLYGDKQYYSDQWGDWASKNITANVDVSPASSNFIYNDVVIEVTIYGKYNILGYYDETRTCSQTVTISLNVGGSGSGSKTMSMYDTEDYSNYAMYIKGTSYLVVSVSGTVERA